MMAECCDALVQRQYFGEIHEFKDNSLRELKESKNIAQHLRLFYDYYSMI